MTISLKVKGSRRSVPAEADAPLLDVLGNDLAFNGAAFGCGLIPGEISARTNWGAPKIRALYEATFFAGLRKGRGPGGMNGRRWRAPPLFRLRHA
jgi:hypothetical protein